MENSSNSTRQFLFYFSFVMVLVYIAIGLLLIFSNVFIDLISRNRPVIGAIFILYGLFRLYMLNRLRTSRKNYEKQNNLQ